MIRLANKYRAQAVTTDEGRFASRKEHRHWCELKLRERAGEIRGLERQVRFKIEHEGVHICDYIADATYFEDGALVVADAKGYPTPEFKIKRKLMRAFYNVDVVTA